MKLKSDFRRVINIILGATILLCCISSEFAKGATLVWENISYQVSGEESIESISNKEKITPAALMRFNNMRRPTLRQNMIIRFPKITHVAASADETKEASETQSVKTYQIFSANAKSYAMVYAAAEIADRDEQFLAIFSFNGKTWVEIDRIEFVHPTRWSFNQRIKLLPADTAGNESCCFYLEFILSSKDVAVDGIVSVPAVSQYLHGVQLVWHAFSIGSQKVEGLPPFDIYTEDIGHMWPECLLELKADILQKQYQIIEADH